MLNFPNSLLRRPLSFIAILLSLSGVVFSQNQNNIWYFGDKAGLSFNTEPPSPLYSDLFTYEGTASIADPAGNLLFYTNGALVWNKEHDIMPNGFGLAGGESSTQAALIVPLPGSCTEYYLFTTEDHYTNGGMAYSIIDMCLDGGKGDVVTGSKNILVHDHTAEKLTAVLHPNGKDIWIITHKMSSNEFLAYLLTDAGLNTSPVVSAIGSYYPNNGHIGPVKASHDGTKLVSTATFHNIAEMFDFNSDNGEVTNLYNLNQLFNEQRWFYGVEFSPNDQFLYLSTTFVTGYLYQINLETKELVTLNSTPGHYRYGALQMGPNQKIYMARSDSAFIDVIHQPDLPGFASEYQEGGVQLVTGTLSELGLPNFAPYSFFPDTNLIQVDLGNDSTLCAGSSVTLSVQLPEVCEATVLWSDGSTATEKVFDQSGIYWVEVNSSCSSFRDSVRLDFISCTPECGELIAAVYGAPDVNEKGYCLAPATENDAFYIGGNADGAILITKMGLDGSVQWSRLVDPPFEREEHINSMFLDSDGMLVMSGNILLNQFTLHSTFALRYDPLLDVILWHKEYTNASVIRNNSIIQKEAGGEYVVANTTFFSDESENIEILTLDNLTGNVITTFSINNDPADSWENIVDVYFDNNFIYGTGRITVGFENRRNILIKLNAIDGTLSWSNGGHLAPEDRADFAGADIIILNDEIYSLYYGTLNGIDVSKLYLQKATPEGELIWLKQYEFPGVDDGGLEMIASENGIVILGFKRSPGDIALFKIDTAGTVLWANQFEVPTEHSLRKVMIYKTSQLIQVGENLIFTAHVTDSSEKENMVVVKTDLNGKSETPCIISKAIKVHPFPVEPFIYPLNLNVDKSFKDEAVASLETSEYGLSPAEQCLFVDTIFTTIDTSICAGDLFEGYGMTGTFTDTFLLENGCDSIRILHLSVISCEPIVYYNLDACQAYMHNGTNMDYTEFTPAYPSPLVCADISANYLFRSPPQENKHSCTPGVNNSIAMCVSSMPSCTYIAGHEASVVIEIQVNPHPDSVVRITALEFFEKAPLTYSWIDGGSGPNNYPLRYGIRILKNGTDIFRNENIATNLNWTLQSFDFISDDRFVVDTNTLFRIELLPYCPVGNGAEVAAWDLDEVRIYGGCMPVNIPIIQGSILTKDELPIKNVDVYLSTNDAFTNPETKVTDTNGSYLFNDLKKNQSYYLKAYKNDDVLNGVSTLDLVYLQRHLLGIQQFQTLHDYVAADVNRSESVSVADIIDLRKTILGIIPQFPRNTSWRFGILPQDFTTTNLFSFRELNEIPALEQDTLVSDFVGIKIGDLNGDVQLDAWAPLIEKRSPGELNLWMNDERLAAREPVSIDIRSEQHISIAGLQFALALEDLDLITLKPGAVNVSPENAFVTNDGILRISWSQAEALKISKDEILFTLIANPLLQGTLKEKVELVGQPLQPEAYDAVSLDAMKINLSIRDIKDVQEEASFAVRPNPFQSSFNIRLNLRNSGRTVITFYDLSGRIIHQIDKDLPAGESIEKVLDQKGFPTEGIIYCQLVSNGFTAVQKLVKLE